MSSPAFDDCLTPAQRERLELLAEEAGEVVRACMKVLRHGYESCSPLLADPPTNREDLQRELGDFEAAKQLMLLEEDLNGHAMWEALRAKRRALPRWMHHQNPETLRRLAT